MTILALIIGSAISLLYAVLGVINGKEGVEKQLKGVVYEWYMICSVSSLSIFLSALISELSK